MDQKLFDIHCHVSLKPWLFPVHHIYNESAPQGPGYTERLFYNLDDMIGNVRMAIAAHYLPDAELWENMKKRVGTSIEADLLKFFLKDKVERVTEDKSTPTASFEQIKAYIEMFEGEVADAAAIIDDITNTQKYNVSIAISFTDLQQKLDNGATVFLHSVEGLHSIANQCAGFPDIDYAFLEPHLLYLFDKGICQITIAHWFQNTLVSSSGGFPPSIANKINYDINQYNTYPTGYNVGVAEPFIDKMLEIGILIDLCHTHEGARAMIYGRNKIDGGGYKRPLIFSHTGIREVALKHASLEDPSSMPPDYAKYLPNNDDIKAIKDCNGLFGIIFMDYWLNARDRDTPAIDSIVETIIYIRDSADSDGNSGTYDHIAIGTDLDGYTPTPEDLFGLERMPALVTAIGRISGITPADLDKICYGNYIRVLQAGWGKI